MITRKKVVLPEEESEEIKPRFIDVLRNSWYRFLLWLSHNYVSVIIKVGILIYVIRFMYKQWHFSQMPEISAEEIRHYIKTCLHLLGVLVFAVLRMYTATVMNTGAMLGLKQTMQTHNKALLDHAKDYAKYTKDFHKTLQSLQSTIKQWIDAKEKA